MYAEMPSAAVDDREEVAITRPGQDPVALVVKSTDAGDAHVTVSDLNRFAALFADLADADVMEQAWDRSTDG